MFVQWDPIVYIKTGNVMKFLVMVKIFHSVISFKIPKVVCRSHGAHCKGGGVVFPVLI